ncbi:MAG: EF-hand domain-containing protein [Cyanobacteria bacterium P01_H01_bin.74]
MSSFGFSSPNFYPNPQWYNASFTDGSNQAAATGLTAEEFKANVQGYIAEQTTLGLVDSYTAAFLNNDNHLSQIFNFMEATTAADASLTPNEYLEFDTFNADAEDGIVSLKTLATIGHQQLGGFSLDAIDPSIPLELEIFKTVFNDLNNGLSQPYSMTDSEMTVLYENLDIDGSPGVSKLELGIFDTNADAVVRLNELDPLIAQPFTDEGFTDPVKLFELFDLDQDGIVSFEELAMVTTPPENNPFEPAELRETPPQAPWYQSKASFIEGVQSNLATNTQLSDDSKTFLNDVDRLEAIYDYMSGGDAELSDEEFSSFDAYSEGVEAFGNVTAYDTNASDGIMFGTLARLGHLVEFIKNYHGDDAENSNTGFIDINRLPDPSSDLPQDQLTRDKFVALAALNGVTDRQSASTIFDNLSLGDNDLSALELRLADTNVDGLASAEELMAFSAIMPASSEST